MRRCAEIELEPAKEIRYRERSTVERGNSELKDNQEVYVQKISFLAAFS